METRVSELSSDWSGGVPRSDRQLRSNQARRKARLARKNILSTFPILKFRLQQELMDREEMDAAAMMESRCRGLRVMGKIEEPTCNKSVPQRLKPPLRPSTYGTDESVPLTRRSLFSNLLLGKIE